MRHTVISLTTKGVLLPASLCASLITATLITTTLAPQAHADSVAPALAVPLSVCTTLQDVDFAAAFTGWTPVPLDHPTDGMSWAWLMLDERIMRQQTLFDPDHLAYLDERFAQHQIMRSQDLHDGYIYRLGHASGWHLAVDLDHEVQRTACILWHDQDRWADIATLTGLASPPVQGDARRDVSVQHGARITQDTAWTTQMSATVLPPDTLPNLPRSYLALSITAHSPEDGG